MSEKEYLPGCIRDRIVDLKRTRGVTNKTIAEKTGLSESLLSRIESGKQQTVNDDVVLALAKFFGVSTDFLLGRTDVPDRKNYTIEELGLTPEAARNLYTGTVDNRVINLLLAHPDFGTLTNRIADYLDDTMAAGIAAQNQFYDSVSDLMTKIGKEDKTRRQAAITQAKEARSLRRKLYADELAQIESLFKGILSSIKKSAPTGKTEIAKAMTKEAFDHMVSEVTKGGSVVEVLKVEPEEITRLIAQGLAITNGASEEEQELVAKTLLPFFPKGKTG